jgi:menaquinol-cytochrome c reductase iron-sulfur subunit
LNAAELSLAERSTTSLTPSPADKPHVPGPSIWPFVLALAIALILIGIVVDPKIVVTLGVVILVVALVGWTREKGGEHAEAPVLEPEQRAPKAPPIPANEGEAAATPTSDEELEEKYPRSVFLESATLGLGAVIGGLVTVPALGFALLPAFTKQHKVRVDLGPLDNFPESDNQWTIATFMTDPTVGEVSRQTAYIRNNGAVIHEGKPVPSLTIISNHCAHLGCPVQPAGPIDTTKTKTIHTTTGPVTLIPALPAGGFACPCHGGAYDQEGNRTAGPPVRSLDRFNYSIVNGHLFLEKPYSVGTVKGTGKHAEIWKYSQHNPGQHVDGIERFFYPVQPPAR